MKRYTEEFFQKKLDDDYIFLEVIAKEHLRYVFYTTKEHVDSGFNDKYILVGVGPMLYNTLNDEHQYLGSMEFLTEHYDSKYFPEVEETLTIEKVITDIKNRNHINFDEFEFFMEVNNIDMVEISISSEDFRHEKIHSSFSSTIDLFVSFFEKTEMSYQRIDNNTVILDNGEFF